MRAFCSVVRIDGLVVDDEEVGAGHGAGPESSPGAEPANTTQPYFLDNRGRRRDKSGP